MILILNNTINAIAELKKNYTNECMSTCQHISKYSDACLLKGILRPVSSECHCI